MDHQRDGLDVSAIQQALLGEAAAGGAGATDPFFSSVVLLCHFDGANNQNTTVDSSSSNKTMTSVTATTLSTAQAKFGPTSTNTSAGGTRYWELADSPDWDFGSGQFTIEAWVYFLNTPSAVSRCIASQWQANGNLSWFFGRASTTELCFQYTTAGGPAATLVGAAWTPSTGQWYHVAADRDASNVLRVYLNGAVHASATAAVTIFNSSATLQLVGSSVFSGMDGYIDELRITKGVARYAGAFTPPTAAFPDS